MGTTSEQRHNRVTVARRPGCYIPCDVRGERPSAARSAERGDAPLEEQEIDMSSIPIIPETAAAGSALERRLDRLGLTGKEDAWLDRYLLCEHLVDPLSARPRLRSGADARFTRAWTAQRGVRTRQARAIANPKRIYYLSMEFLIGRTLNNNIMNLAAAPLVQRAMQREGWELPELLEEEPDAGLGNGGLGRLAACFLDSLASPQDSALC